MKKTVSVSAFIVAFSAVAGLAVMSTACGDDDTTNPGNTTSSSSGTSGTTSSSGTSGTTSSSGTSGTSGSTSGAVTQDKVYAATCARSKKCTPNAFGADFADDAACATFYKALLGGGTTSTVTYPGTATPSQADVDKCADALSAAACVDAAKTPAECVYAGTQADDAACNFASQCSGGDCKKAATADACGKCAKAAAVTEKKKGDTCAVGDVCEKGTACVGATGAAKCDTPKNSGDACVAANNECVLGTACGADGKCAEAKYAKDGEKCGLDGSAFILCGTYTHTCVDAKCVANGKEGDACEAAGTTPATKPSCGSGLTCTDSKCAKPAAVEPPAVCK